MAEGCDKLNELLKHGILADADHDFGLKPGDIETILKGTDESICPDIPERGNAGGFQTYDEDNLLFELLKNDNEYDFDGNKNFNKKLLDTLQENKYKIQFGDVGYESNTYEVSLLHHRGEINMKTLSEEDKIRETDIHRFFNDRNEKNILIDSGSIEFLNLFQKKRYRVNRIINREKLNDPCPSSKTLGELEGITDIVDNDKEGSNLEEDESGDISYSYKFHSFNNDKFFSNYDFYLSPPQRKNPKNPNSSLYARLLIIAEDGDDYETIDSRENSIKSCNTALLTRPEKEWPIIYQRKRAGDWLMVLSSFDTNRIYLNNDSGKQIQLDKIIIKTIDRILLWYALLLGADVLYEAQGSLIFFKNLSKKEGVIARMARAPLKEASPVKARSQVASAPRKVEERKDFYRPKVGEIVEAIQEGAKVRYPAKVINVYIDGVDVQWTDSGKKEWVPIGKIFEIPKGRARRGGSANPSKKLCNDYLTELRSDLECFESEDNSDYGYYENTAFIVLACLNEYRTSANVYEQMQAILFDILPSIEGYIKCKEPEIQQFFGKDEYTADCTAYAARNIALHSLGLRTGKLESLGNRAKHSVKIPPSAVEFYKKIEQHLEKSTFEERKEWIIQQLQTYHGFLHSSKPKKSSTRKLSGSKKKSSTRKLSAPRALSAKGGTRRK